MGLSCDICAASVCCPYKDGGCCCGDEPIAVMVDMSARAAVAKANGRCWFGMGLPPG